MSNTPDTGVAGGANGVNRRHRLARWALPAVLMTGGLILTSVPDASGQAPNTRPAAVPTRALPRSSVPLTGGTSALYSTSYVVSASTTGAIIRTQPRGGDAQPISDYSAVTFLPAGKTAAETLHPSFATGYQMFGNEYVVGDMITYVETDYASDNFAVWWYDLATEKSGVRILAAGQFPSAGSPTGALVTSSAGDDTTTVLDLNVVTGATTQLGLFVQFDGMLGGPSGAVVSTVTKVQYVTYSPVHATILVHNSRTSSWQCMSVTTNATACVDGTTLARFNVPAGTEVKTTVPADLQNLVVTPLATAWVTCGTTSCEISRVPAGGGSTTNVIVPPVNYYGSAEPGGVEAVGDAYIWGQLENNSPNGGMLEMSDTSTTPHLVLGSQLSPVAAASVAVSGSTVYWLDNAKPTLAVWSRSLSGTASVTLGPPTQVASAGYTYTDGATYGIKIAASGTEVAHGNYENQPTTSPVSLYVRDGSSSVEVSKNLSGYYEPLYISGNYALYVDDDDAWQLADLATKTSTALPDNVTDFALGGGELAWVAGDGSVWEEAAGSTTSKELAPALPSGHSLAVIGGVATDGPGDVAWSYTECDNKACTVESAVAEYLDTAVSSTARSMPDPGSVTADLVMAGDEVGYLATSIGSADGDVYVVDVAASQPAPVLLASNSYGLSISSSYAAWIGAGSHLPYVSAI